MSEDSPSYAIANRERSSVDAPASNELDRAQQLAGNLSRAISMAEHVHRDRVSIDIEEAREL